MKDDRFFQNMFGEFFGNGRLIIMASSPGRLDVMGGIADYSGSLVLQKTIGKLTTVAVSARADNMCNIHTHFTDKAPLVTPVVWNLEDFIDRKGGIQYAALREASTRNPLAAWSLYPLGCLLILIEEKQIFTRGADIWIYSDIPLGKGVSSSAALEVASLLALARLHGVMLSEMELPMLAQKVENKMVGAPCGLMDQVASYFGVEQGLLPILCQPAELSVPIPIPKDVHFIGVDSGVRHEVQGASYTDVRTAAFMGYALIAQQLGVKKEELDRARQSGSWDKLPFKGYLANIAPDQFEAEFAPLLPETLKGSDFLKMFGSIHDTVTHVKPQSTYRVLAATNHPVQEHYRVGLFKRLLESFNASPSKALSHSLLFEMGRLMRQSHQSYSACGLGHSRTDELCEMMDKNEEGIWGAKITGGGSGGTVCALAFEEQGRIETHRIAQAFASKYQIPCVTFPDSAPGGYYQLISEMIY